MWWNTMARNNFLLLWTPHWMLSKEFIRRLLWTKLCNLLGRWPAPSFIIATPKVRYYPYRDDSQNEAQRAYLTQGHLNRMTEPRLRAQICLASKCVLSATPHCGLNLVITGNISSYPSETNSDKLLPFLFLCSSLSFNFSLHCFFSLFLFLSCLLSCFPSFFSPPLIMPQVCQ